MDRTPLPVDGLLPEIIAGVARSQAVIVRAPTGSGKTTRVPPALLTFPGNQGKLIIVLEPRRVAARAAARRMAEEHGTPLGQTIGYHVRFDRKTGPNVHIVVMTPGVFLRMCQDDPFLERVGSVILDEFHERSLELDLAVGLVRLLVTTVRQDLGVIIMSATLETETLAQYFDRPEIITAEGRSYPVEIRYQPFRKENKLVEVMPQVIANTLQGEPGDVLAFLPGLGEIRQVQDRLEQDHDTAGALILPLHGELPPEVQDQALRKQARRKVVLATNVAETSVTVESVSIVIDSGLARQREFDASVGLDRLRLVPISQASADQRAGRAGRTGPGVCIRLWDEPGQRSRPPQTAPEITRIDLAPAFLQLIALGEADVARFPWLTPPTPDTSQRALDLLTLLGAIENGKLTPLGQQIVRYPVHPRLGRLLVEAERFGITRPLALAAAILSERDPLDRSWDRNQREVIPTWSDLLDRVEALDDFARTGRTRQPIGQLHAGSARYLLQVRDQFLRIMDQTPPRENGTDPQEAFLKCLLAAYPDRLARRRNRNDRRGIMTGGRGVVLTDASGVIEPELFLCLDLEGSGQDARVRLASGIHRAWLPAEQIVSEQVLAFDETSERVQARKITRFQDIILDDQPATITDESEAARILATAACQRLERVLPAVDSPAGRWRLRVQCLQRWRPELELPPLDESTIRDMLTDLCQGCKSFAELRAASWLDAFRQTVTYPQQQVIEREAPDGIAVPSGRVVPLVYQEQGPPILAAKIQELFGLSETPTVASGRVKVLVHLLAPNGRPQQVTDDLASFWRTTYAIVRKELRGRYPKHDWPEDPYTAIASRGPKRRPGV